DRNQKYAEKIMEELKEKVPGLRIESDFKHNTIPSKVKDAEIMRIPYVIVVGDNEEKDKTIAVRTRGDKKIQQFSVKDFSAKLGKEIKERE
ncbi:threonine--tRNA ligase, partial [Candidatus Woesearchaeota archaeon]|nr:threonine--tRNA ligase [Candidatus Woesearchaeota archaeon]